MGFEPRTPFLEHTCLQGTVERSNADRHRCISSVFVNVLTKGQGGAILRMEDTTQELGKIENGTNRE